MHNHPSIQLQYVGLILSTLLVVATNAYAEQSTIRLEQQTVNTDWATAYELNDIRGAFTLTKTLDKY